MPDHLRRILRPKQIRALLPLTDALRNKLIREGKFPQPVVLTPGASRELVGFFEDEILSYLASLPRRLAHPTTQTAYVARRKKAKARRDAKAAAAVQRPLITRPKE